MTVELAVSRTLTGVQVSDLLTGGSTGYNWGASGKGVATPDELPFFVKHDGVNEITNLAVNVQAYTGTYAGNYSASADLAKIQSLGDADFGIQIDFRWDGSPKFGVKTQVKTGVGDSFLNRILMPVESMSRNNSGTEADASGPVAGTLGPIGNTVYGDRAHITMRWLTPPAETELGKRQFDIYFSYNFSS